MKRTNFINKKISEPSGITLVALVVTIIVLLILARVTIVTLTGDNGLLQKAGEAKNTTIEAEGLEKIQLAVMASHENRGINTTSLAENLSKINGLTDTNNQAILENTVITLPKSIILNNVKYKIKKDGTVIINNNSILPDEYKQVEYIESSGTQYINTNHKASNNIKIELTFSTTNSFTQTSIIGARSDYRLNAFDFTLHKGGWFVYGNNTESELPIDFSNNTKYDVIIDNNNMSYKLSSNNQFINIKTFGAQIFNTDYSLMIFAENWKGSANYKSKSSIYILKIYENNILIRNYIPCYSTTTVVDIDGEERSAGTVGLYDTVEGNFYTNQGTGTFGYGMEDGTYVAPINN